MHAASQDRMASGAQPVTEFQRRFYAYLAGTAKTATRRK
jgi:hypothetical protein